MSCAAVLSPEHALYSVQRATRGVCEGISLNDDGRGGRRLRAWARAHAHRRAHLQILVKVWIGILERSTQRLRLSCQTTENYRDCFFANDTFYFIERHWWQVLIWFKTLIRLQLTGPHSPRIRKLLQQWSQKCFVSNQTNNKITQQNWWCTALHLHLHCIGASLLSLQQGYKIRHVLKDRRCCVAKLTPPTSLWPCTVGEQHK